MQLILQAEVALMRNWRTTLFYLVASSLVLTTYSLILASLETQVTPDMTPKPFWYLATTLSLDLVNVALISGLQAVCFALIGREMDRPLWKCAGGGEALRRFFSYWFIFNLLYITSARLVASAPESIQADVDLAMLFFRFALTVVGVPIGACIMYGGGLNWKEMPGQLAPLFQLFPMSFVALSLGFLQFFIIAATVISMPGEVLKSPWLWSVVNVPLILLETLAFAVMWLVCMHFRDIAPELHDDDFNF